MSFLSYFIPQLVYHSSSHYNKKIEVREINGRNVLLVNGIQQTGGYTEKLWKEGMRNIHGKKILVFGVGGGTVFSNFPDAQITAVDIDPEIIRIGKKYFGLGKLSNLTLIQQDARMFISRKKYDLIIVDLYIGNDVPAFVSQKPFLKKCMSFLLPGGQMVINYFSQKDQETKAHALRQIIIGATVKPVLRNIFVYVVK